MSRNGGFMMETFTRRHGLAAVVIVAMLSGAADAATLRVPLSDLTPGGARQSGADLPTLRYSEFSFRNDSPFAIDPHDVEVLLGEDFNNPDPFRKIARFTFATDAPASASGLSGDLFIDYRVESRDRDWIDRVGLRVGRVPSPGIG